MWHAALVVVLLTGLLRLVPDPSVMPADEVDALGGGFRLADRLTDSDASFKRRLVEGFVTPAGHPRLTLPDKPWRPPVAEAPLPRWLAAFGLMGPDLGEQSNLGRASRGATVAFALALMLLLAIRWRDDPAAAVVAGLVLVSMPGVLASAASAGAAAAGVFAMACWLAAMHAGVIRRGWAWPIGVACGLCLAVHPGASVLLIAVFVAWAVQRRAAPDTPPDGGEAPLPGAPVGLYLVPLVAIATLVILWPSLWSQSSARLGAWLLETFQIQATPQSVAAMTFDQASDRAPQAWTALAQWGAWSTWPVIIAWGLGVREAWVAGRGAAWTPIIATSALLFVGTLDGGLFNGRLSLLSLLWVPTALTAAVGILSLGRRLAAWRGWRPVAGVGVASAALLALALTATLTGGVAPSAGGLGALSRTALPVSVLRAVDREAPGTSIHIDATPEHWRDSVQVARDHLGLDVVWAAQRENADWLMVPGRDHALRDMEPRWRDRAWGVPWAVYAATPPPTR